MTVPYLRVGRPTKMLVFWWTSIWQSALMLILFTIYPVERGPNWFPRNLLPITLSAIVVLFFNVDSSLIGLHPNGTPYCPI